MLRVVLALAFLVAAIGLAFHFAVLRPVDRLAREIAHEFAETFHFTPEIHRGDVTVVEQTTPVLELVSAQREIADLHEWTNTWLGSTKKIVVHGSYLAKAGFDLHRAFSITISEHPLRLRAILPAPRVLSCALQNYRIVQDENGWWNQVTSAERETVFKELQTAALAKAESSDLRESAKTMLQSRLQEIAQKNGAQLEIEFVEPAQLPSAASMDTVPLSVAPTK